jgi:opacity protein-like surface antigen
MKKFLLLFTTASLMLGGAAFAKEDNGAIGFGVISDSAEKGLGGIRGNLFIDVGYQVVPQLPLFWGFELQGDLKKVSSSKSDLNSSEATVYQIDESSWLAFIKDTSWSVSVDRYDLDLSPRGYLSVDLGSSLQVLGYAGLNYNWNSIDTTVTNNSNSAATFPYGNWGKINGGESSTETKTLDGRWDVVAGARASLGAFYLEYTRFLKPTTTGDYSWNSSTKNRLGLGINLRF